jgi:hypothetical protein
VILDEVRMRKHTYEAYRDKIKVENIITALFKDYKIWKQKVLQNIEYVCGSVSLDDQGHSHHHVGGRGSGPAGDGSVGGQGSGPAGGQGGGLAGDRGSGAAGGSGHASAPSKGKEKQVWVVLDDDEVSSDEDEPL